MIDADKSRTRRGDLSAATFDRLLACLDADRERAGERYQRIREKLVKFFQWRGCTAPEEYADRTIDRVARRLDEGAELRVADPYLYFHGVAVMILREHWREPARTASTVDAGLNIAAPATADIDHEHRLTCLDECLRALPGANRDLLVRYHLDEAGSRILGRVRLARELGVAPNALRIRAHRIRGSVHACIEACLARGLRP